MADERGNILLEAHETINQRKQLHGAPENTFAIIADMWNGYLAGLAKTCDDGDFYPLSFPLLTSVDVAHLMVLFKLARQINGADCKDDHRDAAGYIALAADMAGNNDGHHGALLGYTGKDVQRYFDAVRNSENSQQVFTLVVIVIALIVDAQRSARPKHPINNCPACGSPGSLTGDLFDHHVRCSNLDCAMTGPKGRFEENAIAAWNALPPVPKWYDEPKFNEWNRWTDGTCSNVIFIRQDGSGVVSGCIMHWKEIGDRWFPIPTPEDVT